ncbi:MAG TPA: hypothetical protein VF667_00860 [Pseudonocardia sp.]
MADTAADRSATGDSGPITDGGIAAVLRPFVRATRPLLGALSDSDPFGLQARAERERSDPAADAAEHKRLGKLVDRIAETRLPGTVGWTRMDAHERSEWWVRRVGRLTSLVAAVPGFGGVVTRQLPITAALGAAAQGLVLCAIADEHGVTDEAELVALLGAVLFRRDLSPEPRAALGESSNAEVDARAAELTGALEREERPTLQRIASAVWRMGRALLALEGELGKRPQGGRVSRFIARWVSLLPVAGVAGKYIGEWAGLKSAAKAGEEWLHARGR